MISSTRQVALVSTGQNGTLGNYHSGYNSLSISRDGNLVSFYTYATNLFSPDPYGADYALKNMATGSVGILTQAVDGNVQNGTSGGAVAGYDTITLSADGTFAAFASSSNLLKTNDGTDEDIFKLDLSGQQLQLISDAQGGTKTLHAMAPDISDNGRYIVFTASENLLAPTDRNGSSDTDVYWYDSATGQLRLISGEFDGSFQGGGNGQEGDSEDAHVSNDGRFVVFTSIAANLRPDSPGGGSKQLFLRDVADDRLYLISTSNTDAPANGNSQTPEITPDGRYVVFVSNATNLVEGVSGWNIFRLDLANGAMEVVNKTATGAVVDHAFNPEITPDGRYVVFESAQTQLVPGATGTGSQIYVKDMKSGAIAMVSTSANGTGGNAVANAPQISDDGQYIVFNTTSSLVSTDTNGYEDVYRVYNPVYAWEDTQENDTFVNSPEAQSFNGGAGLDTVVYSGDFSNYALAKTASGYSLSLQGAVDQLTGVERLRFWDKNVALDVSDNAKETLQFIGIVASPLQSNLAVRGLILEFLDQGQTLQSLSQLAIQAGLVPNTDAGLAAHVIHNVMPGASGAQFDGLQAACIGYIGQHGQAKFMADVANLGLNVDLVGLQQHGMDYIG